MRGGRSRRRRARAGALVTAAALGLAVPLTLAPGAVVPAGGNTGSTLDRPDQPVVLTGAVVPSLIGVATDRLVAFRHDGGAWAQVPVQVDERRQVDFGTNPRTLQNPMPEVDGTVYGTAPVGITALQYTAADTFVGPDTTPGIDADDEIALLAADAGGPAPPGAPAGVDLGSRIEVTLTDPLDPGAVGHLYLFESDGSLDPAAGGSGVDYDFVLSSGTYRSTYDRRDGPNPEQSVVTTPSYQHRFSDRWILDEARITAGTATGVDILDRHRFQFSPTSCVRHTGTFSAAEGAFSVNVSGPVRAIRSYVGANSGPFTQRTHLFYPHRHEIVTDLRVHPIPGLMDFWDLSPAAIGMTYHNSAHPAPAPVDGVPDDVGGEQAAWELVTGPQGSVMMTNRLTTTDLPPDALPIGWYHEDDDTPVTSQCEGDGRALGNAGPWIVGVPCTDPGRNDTADCASAGIQARRVVHYAAPGATPASAEGWSATVDTPLTITLDRSTGRTCDGAAVTVDLELGQVPTEGDDVIRGTSGDDTIAALGGDDRVCGLDGDDLIDGGSGADRVFAGRGTDSANGRDDGDLLDGGRGPDRLVGDSGPDTLRGQDGADVIDAGRGDDTLSGGPRRDTCRGGRGRDTANGCEVRVGLP